VPEYDDQGVMTSQLFGDRAEMQGGGEIKITGLRVEVYKDGETMATVTAPHCFYNQKTKEAHSDAPIAVDLEQLALRGRGFVLKSEDNSVRVFDECVVTIKDLMGQVNAEAAQTAQTNTETVITSKTLSLNYKTRVALFETDVHVLDARAEVFCETLKIQFGQDNEINWIGASNGVRILSEEREALADEAAYDVKTDEFLLQGSPMVRDGKSSLRGGTIRFWRRDMRVVCEPSARMIVYSDANLRTGFFE
jgi:lipopolysaccharide export system protein LptA